MRGQVTAPGVVMGVPILRPVISPAYEPKAAEVAANRPRPPLPTSDGRCPNRRSLHRLSPTSDRSSAGQADLLPREESRRPSQGFALPSPPVPDTISPGWLSYPPETQTSRNARTPNTGTEPRAIRNARRWNGRRPTSPRRSWMEHRCLLSSAIRRVRSVINTGWNFRNARGCDIDYSWPTNTLLGYRGVGASNSGGTNNGTALPNSYDRDPNGTWVNYSQAQQNCSGQTNALGPLGTFWYGHVQPRSQTAPSRRRAAS